MSVRVTVVTIAAVGASVGGSTKFKSIPGGGFWEGIWESSIGDRIGYRAAMPGVLGNRLIDRFTVLSWEKSLISMSCGTSNI